MRPLAPLSPSSRSINIENCSTPNKTMQKQELSGVSGEGEEENIGALQREQKYRRPQTVNSPSPCMASSKTLAEYEAALRDITERYEAQTMEIAALKAEKSSSIPDLRKDPIQRVTEEGGHRKTTMGVTVQQSESMPDGAPPPAPQLKINGQKAISRASSILHEVSALLVAKAEALEKEEAEDLHSSERQMEELEASIAMLTEELALEREAAKGLREYAFAAQTETSELREFGAREAEVSLSEEIKHLQNSLSDRDQELADARQSLQEVRHSMETEYSQLRAMHADKEEELGLLKCEHESRENECTLLQDELSSKNEYCMSLLEEQAANAEEIAQLKATLSSLKEKISDMSETLTEIDPLKEEVTRLNTSQSVRKASLSTHEGEMTLKEEKITSIIMSLSILQDSLLEKGYVIPSETQIECEMTSNQEITICCKEVARFSAFISNIEKNCEDFQNREIRERSKREAMEEQVSSLHVALGEVARERESLRLIAESKDAELLRLKEVCNGLEDQLLVCRSEPSVGEKKEDYNVDDRATATATEERGVDLLDLVGNAEMATMMDELKTVLEMEKAKCRALEEELNQNQRTGDGSAVSDEHSLSQVEELRMLHVEISELRAKASAEAKAAIRAKEADMQLKYSGNKVGMGAQQNGVNTL